MSGPKDLRLILVCILTVLSLVFVLAVLLYRSLLRRGGYWSALVAFPAAWTSFEYLLNLSWPHGTLLSLAYSQLNFLAFLQVASITGPWGITFLLLLFPTSIGIGLHLRASAPKRAKRIVGATVAAIAVTVGFGALRLALPASGQTVKVGLIASDPPVSPLMADAGAPTMKLLLEYAGQGEALAAQGAQVIVLPEKLGVVVEPDIRDMDVLFQSLAEKTHAAFVVGVIRVNPPPNITRQRLTREFIIRYIKFIPVYNEARVYRPGHPVLTYDKHHMLPPFESGLKPGTTRTLMQEPFGTLGISICKDMDFTPLSREYGEAGVGLMLVPAWDFVVDRIEHGHMALMRGVESGFSIVRAARQGLLTVSDNRGRILAETASDSAHFSTLLATVPATHDTTLYLLLGDWFAWLALGTLFVTLVQLYRLRG
jgi:apolipoprotein N-acyltransferase